MFKFSPNELSNVSAINEAIDTLPLRASSASLDLTKLQTSASSASSAVDSIFNSAGEAVPEAAAPAAAATTESSRESSGDGDGDDLPRVWNWDTAAVESWVSDELHYPEYSKCFAENKVTGRKLILMTMSNLIKIGIQDFGHARHIASKIRDIIRSDLPAWNRSIRQPPRDLRSAYLEFVQPTGRSHDSLSLAEFESTMYDGRRADIALKTTATAPTVAATSAAEINASLRKGFDTSKARITSANRPKWLRGGRCATYSKSLCNTSAQVNSYNIDNL